MKFRLTENISELEGKKSYQIQNSFLVGIMFWICIVLFVKKVKNP